MSNQNDNEVLKNQQMKAYTRWLIEYQKEDLPVMKHFYLTQMKSAWNKYEQLGFDTQDLKDVTPSAIYNLFICL